MNQLKESVGPFEARRCAVVAALFILTSPLHAAEERYWEQFPKPPGRSAGVSSMGLDEDNGLWIMSGQGCYHWNARNKEWVGPLLSAGEYLTRLYGTPETGLYATQKGNGDHTGAVYRVRTGKVECVTTFYYDVTHHYPGFHVSLDGRLVNWGGKKLRVYADGQWTERDADLLQMTALRVFDRGDTISLCSKEGLLLVVDRQNRISEMAVDKQVKGDGMKGVLWGNDSAMILHSGSPAIHALDVRTGELIDASAVNQVLENRPVFDLFRARDGAVWIIAHDRELASEVLYRAAPDGTTEKIAATAGVPWDHHWFTTRPESVRTDPAGTLWFASREIGVFTLKDGRVRQFDHRTDNSPALSDGIMVGADGIVYARGGDRLHAYNNGVSLTGLPPPEQHPVTGPGMPAWKRRLSGDDWLARVWYVDDLLLFVSMHGSGIQALDPRTGRTRFSIPASRGQIGSLWVSHGSRDGRLTACLSDRILVVESASGATARSVPCKRDHRIAPAPIEEDFVLVSQYQSTSLERVDALGSRSWTCRLPGYVMTHPSVCGSLLMVQTRGSSYGGQATSGVDLETGKVLWSETVNAYGCGVVLADDARYSVEGDMWLAPNATEGRLICREPRTGTARWTYRKPQTTLSHTPVLDPVTDRVYAVLDDGTVVCVDGECGKTLWEQALPDRPLRALNTSHYPYQSCLSLHDGLLLLTSSDATLYVLDVQTGEIRERIALTKDTFRHGARARREELVAAPWMVGDLLIVPSESGISAYKHDLAQYRPQGVAPTVAWSKAAPEQVETGTIMLEIKASSAEKTLVVRYRHDAGGWKKETFNPPEHCLTLRQLANGPHSCEIQVYDLSGRSSNRLAHRFTVDCDYETVVNNLLVLLGSEKSGERDMAEKRLLELGPPVLPHLEKCRRHEDPEIRLRVDRILRGMGKTPP